MLAIIGPPAEPIWCAGCGHFGVQGSLVRALDTLAIERHQVPIALSYSMQLQCRGRHNPVGALMKLQGSPVSAATRSATAETPSVSVA